MANYCDNNISFISTKRSRLDKIIYDLDKNKGNKESYGNLFYFDTLYEFREVLIDILKVDSETLHKYFEFMYSKLLYVYLPYVGSWTRETIISLFNDIKMMMNGEKQIPEEIAYNNKQSFKMRYLLEPDNFSKYYRFHRNNRSMIKDNIPDSLSEWQIKNYGVNGDISIYSQNGTDKTEIFYDGSKYYYIDIYGDTRWDFPLKFIQKICKKYKVKAEVKYCEPGTLYAGIVHVNKKGKITYNNTITPDDNFDVNQLRHVYDMSDYDIISRLVEELIDDIDCEDTVEEKISLLNYLFKSSSCNLNELYEYLESAFGEYDGEGKKIFKKYFYKKKPKNIFIKS